MGVQQKANTRIARNSIFMSCRMVIVLGITFYSTKVLLASLGIVDYGVYNVVCGFVSLFSFLNTSMANGFQRFYNYSLGQEDNEGVKNVFNTALFIQLLLSAIVTLLTESLGLWYLNSVMVIPPDRLFAANVILQTAILCFIITIAQAPFLAAIMAHERMDFYAIVSIIDITMKLFVAVSLYFIKGDRLIWYGILFACTNAITFFLYLQYTLKHFKSIRLKRKIHKTLLVEMITFSGWNFFGSFTGVAREQGMNLILNFFFGPIVNAAKGIATQVNGGLQSFVQNISVPMRPQVVQSYAAGDHHRAIKITYSVSKLSCCILYTLALPVCLEIHYILSLWLEEKIPPHTETFVILVIINSFIGNLNSAVSGIIHASGKMRNYQLITSMVSILCIPTAFFCLNKGASSESALLLIVMFCSLSQMAALRILKSVIDYCITDYLKKVIIPFALLVLTTFCFPLTLRELLPESFLRFALVSSVSVGICAVGIFYIVLNHDERNVLTSLINKTRKNNISI